MTSIASLHRMYTRVNIYCQEVSLVMEPDDVNVFVLLSVEYSWPGDADTNSWHVRLQCHQPMQGTCNFLQLLL